MTKKQKKSLFKIIVSLIMVIVLSVIPKFFPLDGFPLLKLGLWLVPYLVVGGRTLLKAAKGIGRLQVFDENFLMVVATVGAIVLGEYTEGVAVMLFYQVGELFESIAVGKSRRNISSLMDIRPDYANVFSDGKIIRIDPSQVKVGDTIVVQPGEKIPLDGTVTKGTSVIDTKALTGESLPRNVEAGSEVLSGCINLSGVIEVRTAKEFGQSTVSKILELVENASSRKSRSENFISKFARWYTPAVCCSALALAVLPPLFFGFSSGEWNHFSQWVYRALTFLVISCPCALVISIPLTFFSGIGRACSEGILIKGSNYLEALSQTKTVVFDKTGTLTKGVFEVAEILPEGIDGDSLLRLAAFAECNSSHPVSLSLRKAYGKEIDSSLVTEVTEIAGHGISACVEGKRVSCGNAKLMEKTGCTGPFAECDVPGTVVHVSVDGEYSGCIIVSDCIKETTPDAIRKLKAAGIRKTVMLTGDGPLSARSVAAECGIDEAFDSLLPQDKVSCIEKLISGKKPKESVVFAGDGINDAPVLSCADIGIAMGSMGSDAAIEAADVVIMDDDLMKIPRAVELSKKSLAVVYENIWFALSVKAVCLGLGAAGFAGMWLAVFADVGVMVLAVLNSLRILSGKRNR